MILTADSPFWKSPALAVRSKHWPRRYGRRVPMCIRMNCTVRPDFAFILPPEERGMILRAGGVYAAVTNTHGAVCGVCDCGHTLGVKPDEFTVIGWRCV